MMDSRRHWRVDRLGSSTLIRYVSISALDMNSIVGAHSHRVKSAAQELPILWKVPPHFVTRGDGSTDEMCVGVVTSPRLRMLTTRSERPRAGGPGTGRKVQWMTIE